MENDGPELPVTKYPWTERPNESQSIPYSDPFLKIALETQLIYYNLFTGTVYELFILSSHTYYSYRYIFGYKIFDYTSGNQTHVIVLEWFMAAVPS